MDEIPEISVPYRIDQPMVDHIGYGSYILGFFFYSSMFWNSFLSYDTFLLHMHEFMDVFVILCTTAYILLTSFLFSNKRLVKTKNLNVNHIWLNGIPKKSKKYIP